MKPFNLEEYFKHPNRKLVTRSGRPARIVCTDAKGPDNSKQLVVLIEMDGGTEYVTTMPYTGVVGNKDFKDLNLLDLMFAPTKREGWINIYSNSQGSFYPGSIISETKEKALETAGGAVVDTVKITWEE